MENPKCSACGADAEVDKLIAGPSIYLCRQCVGAITCLMFARVKRWVRPPAHSRWYCSFCGKGELDARVLVQFREDPPLDICEECTLECVRVFVSQLPREEGAILFRPDDLRQS